MPHLLSCQGGRPRLPGRCLPGLLSGSSLLQSRALRLLRPLHLRPRLRLHLGRRLQRPGCLRLRLLLSPGSLRLALGSLVLGLAGKLLGLLLGLDGK